MIRFLILIMGILISCNVADWDLYNDPDIVCQAPTDIQYNRIYRSDDMLVSIKQNGEIHWSQWSEWNFRQCTWTNDCYVLRSYDRTFKLKVISLDKMEITMFNEYDIEIYSDIFIAT